MTTDRVMKPFRPGAGSRPAYMGHRPEIEQPLLDTLRWLRQRQVEPHFQYLYGPRGNGKTVLLRWLDEEAQKGSANQSIARIRLLPEDLRSPEKLGAALIEAQPWLPRNLKRLRVGLKANVAGWISTSADGQGSSMDLALGRLLGSGSSPVLMTLDEAHEVDTQMLGDLLNAVQYAGQTRPIGIVLAGTPGLVDTLAASKATFWSRGQRLPVDLLSREAAQSVLSESLSRAGYQIDDFAVSTLADVADGYPFFLQLYGDAAWEALRKSDGTIVCQKHAEAAIEAVAPRRREYYRDRYREFQKEGALPLARDVALAFREAGGEMTDSDLNAVLAKYDEPSQPRILLLNKWGFIWQHGDNRWTSGIPSLMDYMIESTASLRNSEISEVT